jgi:hypothetical protein
VHDRLSRVAELDERIDADSLSSFRIDAEGTKPFGQAVGSESFLLSSESFLVGSESFFLGTKSFSLDASSKIDVGHERLTIGTEDLQTPV